MTQLVHSVDLPVGSEAAFELWKDIESFPDIMDSVVKVTVTDSRRSYWEIRLGGIDWEYDAVATSVVDGEYIEWKSTTGELELIGRATFDDLPAGGSRLTIEIVWEPNTFVERVGSLLGDDSRAVARELENFADHVTRVTESRRADAD